MIANLFTTLITPQKLKAEEVKTNVQILFQNYHEHLSYNLTVFRFNAKKRKVLIFYGLVISITVIVRSNIAGELFSLSTCKLIVCMPVFNGSVTNSM